MKKKASPRGRRSGPGHPKARRPRGAASGRAGRASRGTAILHACGHSEKHALPKQVWRREKDLAFQQGRPCRACWAEVQAKESEALCGLGGLPKLTGTAKQVLWGRTLRGRVLMRLQGEAAHLDRIRKAEGLPAVSEAFLALVLPNALSERKAKWWIDHREDGAALHLFLSRAELDQVDEMKNFVVCPF